MNAGKFAAIILAAGHSTRFGTNKLMLKLGQHSMISHALRPFISLNDLFDPIVMITGKYDHEIRKHLHGKPITFLYNENHENGNMSTSIRKGVEYLKTTDFTGQGIFIHLADIPFVEKSDIVLMVSSFSQNKRQIVIPTCDSKSGHPTLFDISYIDELMSLENEPEGMRSLIKTKWMNIMHVETTNKGILHDVDDPSDVKLLNKEIFDNQTDLNDI